MVSIRCDDTCPSLCLSLSISSVPLTKVSTVPSSSHGPIMESYGSLHGICIPATYTGPHWRRCNVMEPLSLDNFIIGHWRRPFGTVLTLSLSSSLSHCIHLPLSFALSYLFLSAGCSRSNDTKRLPGRRGGAILSMMGIVLRLRSFGIVYRYYGTY